MCELPTSLDEIYQIYILFARLQTHKSKTASNCFFSFLSKCSNFFQRYLRHSFTLWFHELLERETIKTFSLLSTTDNSIRRLCLLSELNRGKINISVVRVILEKIGSKKCGTEKLKMLAGLQVAVRLKGVTQNDSEWKELAGAPPWAW